MIFARSATRARRRAGFNMLEVTISTLLVGVLLTGAMTTAGALIRRHGLRAQDDVKMGLAHDLLCEVNQTFFSDPDNTHTTLGPEFGEAEDTRRKFDDVDDYDGWTESVIQDKLGNPAEGFAGFQRSVQVVYARLSDPALDSSVPTDLKRITVRVVGPDQQTATLTGLRSRRGAADLIPGVQSTYVRGVQIRLEAQQASHPLRSGSRLLNQVSVGTDP
ncbi:hypothetical protein [Roseimaritima ulvae]|uniref:hypothetical protein n=1 Tax=Roseimaritima ulvae TaxID=980254 RepID=UPI0012F94E6D|nr:hypothetical protein [Roseimaritima ulvae]